MHEWCEVLSPLKDKLGDAPVLIVVMGEWDGKCCEITAKRQIYLTSRGHA
ncbi:hypothetical protein SDC9_188691 [bioreactor metagenome]|uniref:Uncharacterized protein n=1 Tax=bioreactor metagenome TaxID=1076179 RepID=A0A645HSF6_9ZZZZ